MEDTDDNPSAAAAEQWRLEGNKAFAAKKWDAAITKYRASLAIDGASPSSAKVYSNLAAALCKLSKYDDAHEAAKQATKVDPEWAKGYWRLGVVLELKKNFILALDSYKEAAERAPEEEEVFVRAKDNMLRRLGCRVDRDGTIVVVDPPPTSTQVKDGGDEQPPYVAWDRLRRRTNNFRNMGRAYPGYLTSRDGEKFKSEWWIQDGLSHWHGAMSRQLGELAGMPCDQLSQIWPKLVELKQQMQRREISQVEFDRGRWNLTGLPPARGDEFVELVNALTLLGGNQIPIEMGGGKFIPSPPWLEWFNPQQLMAIQQVIWGEVMGMKHLLAGTLHTSINWEGGVDVVFSPAIHNSAKSFVATGGMEEDEDFCKDGTPDEVIAYIKKKLDEGIPWEKGMRKYIAVAYRGTILSAWLTRLVVGLAPALTHLKWARKFITLADKEWKVTEKGRYEQCGVTFRKSFQVGVLWMELVTAQSLRGNEAPNLEEAIYEFGLAQDIINCAMASDPPSEGSFEGWVFYVSFSRKPLAFACSYLGATMTRLRQEDPDLLEEVVKKTGIMEGDRDDNLMAFLFEQTGEAGFSMLSAIAETYKQAALAQLYDDTERAILWWGYTAHVALAGGYKLGDLRAGINNAVIATQEMDEELLGPCAWKGSTYQKQSMLMARYYQDKRDDFILPRLEMSKRPDGNLALFVDGQLLVHNFDKDMRIEWKKWKDRNREEDDYLDTTEVEQEHGAKSEG
ncbi:hypothetical protein ACHAXT_011888 [Thalassiosira profunda]